MFFVLIGFGVLFATGAFILYSALFWRDTEKAAIHHGALWEVVPFGETNQTRSDLYLALPDYSQYSRILIKAQDHRSVGEVLYRREQHPLVRFEGLKFEVWVPDSGIAEEANLREVGDAIVFWDGTDKRAEVVPLPCDEGKKFAVVMEGREYVVVIPEGTPRHVARVEFDQIVVAEFARADKLSFQRSHLIAVNKSEPFLLRAVLIWLAVNRK